MSISPPSWAMDVGADMTSRGACHVTAFSCASTTEEADVVRKLLRESWDLTLRGGKGST
jgi:hypothetical protein